MLPGDELSDSCHILEGDAFRVRWLRYCGEFPARRFLETRFPEDIPHFLQRVREMADFGRIRLPKNGHQLDEQYAELHQFNLPHTRTWGIRDGRTYVVLSAAKKRTTGQEPDYDRALALRRNYLEGPRE